MLNRLRLAHNKTKGAFSKHVHCDLRLGSTSTLVPALVAPYFLRGIFPVAWTASASNTSSGGLSETITFI